MKPTAAEPAQVAAAASEPLLQTRTSHNKKIETQIIGVSRFFHALAGESGAPASFWVRTLAGGCDFELIAISFLPIFAAYATLNTLLERETFVVLFVLFASLSFVYQLVTLTIAGRTYGMAMLNLRLVPIDEPQSEITKRQKMLRAWAATIAFLCPPLNLLVRMVNSRHLSLPDLVSNTVPVEQ